MAEELPLYAIIKSNENVMIKISGHSKGDHEMKDRLGKTENRQRGEMKWDI